jgi:hypothetical protein
MAKKNPEQKESVALQCISNAEEAASPLLDYANRLTALFTRAKKEAQSSSGDTAILRHLVLGLRKLDSPSPQLSIGPLLKDLEGRLKASEAELRKGFPAALQSMCSTSNLKFTPLPEAFGVGPFSLEVDFDKGSAKLLYARSLVSDKLPFEASAIVKACVELKSEIVDGEVDFNQTGRDIAEAMRVALARENKQRLRGEMRVDVPSVYREWKVVRELSGSTRKLSDAAYSMARFVVEVKQFTQSDENVRAEHPMQLEPAVIENAKNPRKSMFVPRDLSLGFGEGTYCQAIVLREQ